MTPTPAKIPAWKAFLLTTGFGLFALTAVGYYAARQFLRPYDVPEFQEIDTSESAFLIPLEGDTAGQTAFPSVDFLNQKKVAAKRVQIPHRWQEMGRFPGQGNWVPLVRLVKVDRRPVTRLWTKSSGSGTSAKDEAIWAETKESVNFSMGITCTANIPEELAAVYLYTYPSKSLADMMDTEVRGRVQQMLAEEAGRHLLAELPAKKSEVMQAVRADVTMFFKERGILITSIGMYGGLTFDNPEIQKAIDDSARSAQLKVTAEAKREAAEVENKRLRQEAEARTETMKLEAKGKAEAEMAAAETQAKLRKNVAQLEAEAEAIRAEAQAKAKRAVAEAEADGLRKLAEVRLFEAEQASGSMSDVYVRLRTLEAEAARWKGWDGKLPATWMPVGEKATPFTVFFPPLAELLAGKSAPTAEAKK